MDLYLIRHATAEDRNPVVWPDDSRRPLTKKGIRRFKRAAKGLVSLIPEVDILLASPYERAWHTALLLEEAGWPSPLRLDELTQGEPGVLLRVLLRYQDVESVALAGHEPHLSRFATALLGGNAAPWGEMKKGGVARLELAHLSFTTAARLRWYLPPSVAGKLDG